MIKLTLSQIKLEQLKSVISLQEKRIDADKWKQFEKISLTKKESTIIKEIKANLLDHDTILMNEATIWSRAIYPLLLLAEKDDIEAWSQVPLTAKYSQFEIVGIVDGVLGKSIAGRIESPYLVVCETKKGIESENPVFQLYGQLLAAAYQNWQNNHQLPQEIFGCYTVADTWKFFRAEIEGINEDLPTLKVQYSRPYVESLEAEIIFKILKSIVAKYTNLN